MTNVFRKFMVSINVNPARMDELVRAGFPVQKPSPSQIRERRERHQDAAERINRDATRLDRQDDWGSIPDSGRVVFSRDGQTKVSFTKVAADAESLDFVMTAAYVEQIPGKQARFRVWWERGDNIEEMKLSGTERFHFLDMMNRAYARMYGFDNRTTDGGFTFNANGPLEMNAKNGVRDLRIGDGHMACVLRNDA